MTYLIPDEIRTILLSACWSMENHDDTMSGRPTMEANKAREWLEEHTEPGTPEPLFPLSRRFTEGERIVLPGRSGSYPDHTKNRWGYVTEIKRETVTQCRETLVVTLDGEEPRGINPDVVAHGDDWRYAERDPERAGTAGD